MPDDFDLTSMVNDAAVRRLWLVQKAMEHAPIDRAIELARMAEEFIAGAGTQPPLAQAAVVETPKQPQPPIEAAITRPRIEASRAACPGLMLSAEQRDRLLERLANGARNAELATEFGLSPRQVQGVRMGSAREITERRNALPKPTYSASDHSHEQATPDDVVRYLRQQDDIVVPQGEGAFLVNGRFRLELTELVSRANKMRGRQGRPAFRLATDVPGQQRIRQTARHPIFWEQESGSKQASARVN